MNKPLQLLLCLSVLIVVLHALTASERTFDFENPGFALFRKSLKFHKLAEPIRMEIERLARKTMTRVIEFEMSIPPKISMLRLDNEPGNTFNEPFLVGDSHQVRAYHYTPQVLTEWCSGMVSGRTHLLLEHKNRWIHVDFSCNRTTLFPTVRLVAGLILVGLFVNLVAAMIREHKISISDDAQKANDDEKRFIDESSEFVLSDEEDVVETSKEVESMASLDDFDETSHFLDRLDNFELPPRKHISFAVFDDSSLFV